MLYVMRWNRCSPLGRVAKTAGFTGHFGPRSIFSKRFTLLASMAQSGGYDRQTNRHYQKHYFHALPCFAMRSKIITDTGLRNYSPNCKCRVVRKWGRFLHLHVICAPYTFSQFYTFCAILPLKSSLFRPLLLSMHPLLQKLQTTLKCQTCFALTRHVI